MKLYCVFILFTTSIFPQWELLTADFTPFGIKYLEVKSNNKIIAVDEIGSVFISEDSMKTWKQTFRAPGTYNDFNNYFPINDNKAYHIVYDNEIGKQRKFITEDGGITFKESFFADNSYIYDLKFFNDSIAYASLHNSLSILQHRVIKTTNHGNTWDTILAKDSIIIDNICIFNENDLIVTRENVFYLSSDGGLSWDIGYIPANINKIIPSYIHKIIKVDSVTAIAVVIDWYLDKSYFFRTIDKGRNWTKVFEYDKYLNTKSFAVKGDTIIMLRQLYPDPKNQESSLNKKVAFLFDAYFFYSFDKGLTWERKNISINYEPNYISYFNDTTIIIGKEHGIIDRTYDLGNTFLTINIKKTLGPNLGMKFINKDVGYINKYHINKTIDGAKTFKDIQPKGTNVYPFSVPKEGVIIAGYYSNIWNDDTLFKTTDDGISWKKIDLNLNTTISSIIFFNNIGYMKCEKLYKSTDYGETWNKIFNDGVGLIFFIDSLNGWISSGNILHTSDGGKTFINQGFSADFISFADTNYGIISSFDQIAYTTNGGKSWILSDFTVPSFRHDIVSLYFFQTSDKLIGYAGLSLSYPHINNVLYETLDTGKSWHKLEMNFADAVRYFDYIDNTLYMSTSTVWGELYRYTFNNIISVEEKNPKFSHSLSQNYPNPFNPSTKIKYTLHKQGLVTIKVYDVLGNVIKTLLNEEKPSGEYEIEFDGSSLSSGIYFYQIQSGEFLDTKKMVLMK